MADCESGQAKAIKALNLTVGWGPKSCLEQVAIELGSGSILVIAGPNGAGKSTLIKAIARQLKPQSGQVLLDQTDIWTLSPKEYARQVAYVPQALEPGQDLTVEELVMLGRNPHQSWWSWSASQEDRQAARCALEKTETWNLRAQYLSSLSGGERQRAIIAMALAQEPRFLLMDEPTSHLDFRHQIELAEILEELRSQGLGIALVLHDLNLMARLADHVLLISKDGNAVSRVESQGPPSSVLEPATLRRTYQVEVSIIVDPRSGEKLFAPSRSIGPDS